MALTHAERQARYRAKCQAETEAEIERLRNAAAEAQAEVASLKAENETLRRAKSAALKGKEQ